MLSGETQEHPEYNTNFTNQDNSIYTKDNSQIRVASVVVMRASYGKSNATISAMSKNFSFVVI